MRTHEELRAAAARVIADGAVSLGQLARKVPADRGRRGYASAESLARWIVRGKSGVYLDGARLAGKGWCSSVAALARFAAALASAEQGVEVSEPCDRERRAAAACAEIERLKGK